jgi:7-cyano-7-deazaguanine synthase in queuosine biosynthesis
MDLLRYIGGARSGEAAYGAALTSAGRRVIDTLSKKANVTVNFDLNGSVAEVPLRPEVRDFLDLAATIYIGDELEARAGAPDGWNRDFRIIFPTSDPDRWRAASDVLGRMLTVLSGDHFDFEWLRASRPLGSYGTHRIGVARRYDAVCLFSGGIDSLLGAYRLLCAEKRVLLVGHQAEGITASAQTRLFRWLKERFKKNVDFLQCRVARAQRSDPKYPLGDKSEESHRPRSFLFLALATAAARAAHVRHIEIPENGLIALNPPLGPSRLGTVSTRTAHPAFLNAFSRLVKQAGVFDGEIQNPFLYLSKTDMVSATDSAIRTVLPETVSCSHAGRLRWDGAAGIRHCGYCLPCIYRRIALMEIGLDTPKTYLRDVFTKLPGLSETERADLRALSRFARRVSSATEAERQALVVAQAAFAHDVGGQLGPGASHGYAEWSGMLKRWADDFMKKLGDVTSAKTKSILGI